MLQASSSGLPVIATDIGSINETILNGETGILIKPKNPDALAQAMIYLAQHPEIRKQMGAAGREHILNRFSHQSVAGRMESFLNSYGKQS
jgi:glycosyltransferase involved in cell wall biosynthesis